LFQLSHNRLMVVFYGPLSLTGLAAITIDNSLQCAFQF